MIPGLAIGAPSTAEELAGMLETAIDHPGPVAIRYPKDSVPAIPHLPAAPVPFGEWEEMRTGSAVLLLAVGRMVGPAAKAATLIEEAGVSCGLVNARWVNPMDPRLAEWAGAYDRVVTIEDNVTTGGFGSAVLEALAPLGTAGKVRVVGLADEFIPPGKPDQIFSARELDPEGIAAIALGEA
jgi:1-deoxy-D-xylulose-5-phosphate synthase